LIKIAHLAEAFRMKCEIHHGGNSLNNVANLHVTMAITNCDYYEVFPCSGANKFGLVDDNETPRSKLRGIRRKRRLSATQQAAGNRTLQGIEVDDQGLV
jgi:L-alanine-DL-glutamate epimerase-like enolase superfamily enzyme